MSRQAGEVRGAPAPAASAATPVFMALLVGMTALAPLSMQIFVPALPAIQRGFAVPTGVAQLALSLSILANAIATLSYGPLSDRFGRRPAVLAGLGLFVVGSVMCALASTIGLLILGTIPVIGAGYLLKEATGGVGLRSLELAAWTMLVFGVLLYAVDKTCLTVRRMEHLGAGSALIIGLFQVLALVPGTSRAGITMTAARLLGYERPDAARFSMLLSIPAIVASGALVV